MSRNADEGFALYKELYYKDIELVFLKEHYIDTSVIKRAVANQIKIQINTGNEATDEFINSTIENINKLTLAIIFEQIREAFKQAQKEVDDLHAKTAEGLITARLSGKQIGQKKGAKLNVKKANLAKEIILKYSKSFNGMLGDEECRKLADVSRNSFYKYKYELKNQSY